jgi:crotonobetainyl-CoA:carnitine CoA-transferase CaiB-like acyl-CoA transferase
MQDPHMGTLVTPAAPLRFESDSITPRFPPRLGQHSREVLQEIGLDETTITRMMNNGSLIQSPH